VKAASFKRTTEERLTRRELERQQFDAALLETTERLEQTLMQLRATQQQLVQQERLRALGEMASGIAHDFNNALAIIVGYTELLLVDQAAIEQPQRVRRDLELVHTAAQDAANVVNRLREFYRPREPSRPLSAVQLNDLVAQAISLTQPRWRDQPLARGINIRVQTELSSLRAVEGDAAELRDVLTNLIFNSVDAMPDGGTLAIRTVDEHQYVRLEVADTGKGMSASVRQRCLEPFFTTKGAGGTGLGLGIVYGIVQRHAGTLDIDSAPGRGTRICIRIPWSAASVSIESSPTPVHSGEPLSILLVEDEPRVRQLITAMLSIDGHVVETARDGRDGLQRFLAGRFDVVITDHAMPELSGDQLVAEIKRLRPATRVIMLTGFEPDTETTSARTSQVDLVIQKPARLVSLRQAIWAEQATECPKEAANAHR
jgi:signal transduction histidine kinase/ActR/RegA family two-component response regulator